MKRISIRIEWCDAFGEGSKQFTDVYQLADFLKDNPDFAEPLKYVPKKEKVSRGEADAKTVIDRGHQRIPG